MSKAVKLQDDYSIKVNLDPVTYGAYKSLNNKQKKVLKKLIKLLIVSIASDEEFSGVLEISTKINFSEEAKKLIREVAGGDGCEVARKAVALLLTLVNMTVQDPYLYCKDFLELNGTEYKIRELQERVEKLCS